MFHPIEWLRYRRVGASGHSGGAVLLLAWVAGICFFSTTAKGADLTWNGKPVVGYGRAAPLQRLQRDLGFLNERDEASKVGQKVNETFAELSAGMDASRPWGLVVYIDETMVPVILVPLKDEAKLFGTLRSRFGWEFNRDDRGFYIGVQQKFVASVSGSWLLVTGATHRESLSRMKEDPTSLFKDLDPAATAQAVVVLDQMPNDVRANLGAALAEWFADAEDADEEKSSDPGLIGRLAQQLLADCRSLELEVQCFRPLEQFHVTTRLVPVKGSKLSHWLDASARRPSLFEHLATDNAVAAVISSMQFDPQTLGTLLDAWKLQSAKARAAAPSPRSNDPSLRLLAKLVSQSLDAVTTTLNKGEFDGGIVVERQGKDHYTLLTGGTLYGSRAIEETAMDVVEMLKTTPEFRALEWATASRENVSIHQLSFPLQDTSAQRIFGNSLSTVLGFGPDRVYAAFGDEEALPKLSLAVDRASEDRPARGEPLRVTLRMAPFLALLAALPGQNQASDAELVAMAERMAAYKKHDRLELSTRATGANLEARLRVDTGVLQMLASELSTSPSSPADAPSPSSPQKPTATGSNLALRLPRGDKFQLEFYTDSKTTTTIGSQDRIDRGRHSLLYDFRLLEVSKDGSMLVEASLNRVTIEKESPEGKATFDSARPPEPDKIDAEMMLHALLVNRKLVLTLRPDGTIAEITGIDEAIEEALNKDLKPPADEREQARAFLRQGLNKPGLRDSLTRGFEFFPSAQVNTGDRWSRTSENYSGINFLLDNRYQLQSLKGDEATISVKSQVRDKEQPAAAEQPIQWEIVGSQSGSIHVDTRTGRLQWAEYALRLQGEATLNIEGKSEVRPIIADFKMIVGEPKLVALKKAAKP